MYDTWYACKYRLLFCMVTAEVVIDSTMDTDGSSSGPPRVEVGSVFCTAKSLRAEQAVPRGWSRLQNCQRGGGWQKYSWRARRGD